MCKFYINRLPLMCTLCSTFRKMLSAAENSQLQKAPCDTSKNIIAPPLPLINKNNKPAKVTSYLCISLFQNSCRNSCHYLSIISQIRRKMAAAATDHQLSIHLGNSQICRKMAAAATDHQLSIHFGSSQICRKMAAATTDHQLSIHFGISQIRRKMAAPAVLSICHFPNSPQDGSSSDRPPAVNSICHSPHSPQDGAGAAAINY